MDDQHRLQDLSARLDRYELRLRDVEDLEGVFRELQAQVAENTHAIARVEVKADSIITRMEERERQAGIDRKAARAEHRRNRQWIVGSVIATAGVIVAAVAVLIQLLGQTP